MKTLTLLLLALTVSYVACSTVQQDVKKDIIYRRDMELLINKAKYSGTGVVPLQRMYEFVASAPNDMDFFIYRTCHREVSTEDAGEKKRYVFVPIEGLETNGACPAELVGLNKKGRHSFGYVAFEESDKKLPANIKCNGVITNSQGTSLCQAAQGLVQEISFQGDAILSDLGNENKSCALDIEKNNKRFEFKMPSGKCFYTFMEVSDPHRRHRLYTLGYQEILLQQE
jgi:hypothetical protein